MHKLPFAYIAKQHDASRVNKTQYLFEETDIKGKLGFWGCFRVDWRLYGDLEQDWKDWKGEKEKQKDVKRGRGKAVAVKELSLSPGVSYFTF